MSLELKQEQCRAIEEHPDEPVCLVDPASQRSFVLISAEVYDLIKERLEAEEDRALQKAWLDSATRTRRKWVKEKKVTGAGAGNPDDPRRTARLELTDGK